MSGIHADSILTLGDRSTINIQSIRMSFVFIIQTMIGNLNGCACCLLIPQKTFGNDLNSVIIEPNRLISKGHGQNALVCLLRLKRCPLSFNHQTAMLSGFFWIVHGIHDGQVFINRITCGTGILEIDILYSFVKQEQASEEYLILKSEEICRIIFAVIIHRLNVCAIFHSQMATYFANISPIPA